MVDGGETKWCEMRIQGVEFHRHTGVVEGENSPHPKWLTWAEQPIHHQHQYHSLIIICLGRLVLEAESGKKCIYATKLGTIARCVPLRLIKPKTITLVQH